MRGYYPLKKNMEDPYTNEKYVLGLTYYSTSKYSTFPVSYTIEGAFPLNMISQVDIYIVDAGEPESEKGDEMRVNEISFVRKLSKGEIRKYLEERKKKFLNGIKTKLILAEYGVALDKLATDKDSRIRSALAFNGKATDLLVNDPLWSVRGSMAEGGHKLDVLMSDPDWLVRASVADKGYGLDVLLNDSNEMVRKAAEEAYQKREATCIDLLELADVKPHLETTAPLDGTEEFYAIKDDHYDEVYLEQISTGSWFKLTADEYCKVDYTKLCKTS